jgi:transcriptional regulator with XRE-family HTH domain
MRMDLSPTVRGRRLVRELIRLRENTGLSREAAAKRVDFSVSKLYRIEAGRTRVSTDDLEDLLDLYGVHSPEREALIQLGRDARRRGWWTAYSDVFTGSYIGLEFAAKMIRVNATVVPGFLQTDAYARAIIASTGPGLGEEEIDRRVKARKARREALFDRPDPPGIHVVLDEAVLRRHIGGAEVTREQLAALIEAAERPNVTIQVLPFSAGGHAGLDGEFVILVFPDPQDPPVAYIEGLHGDLYLEVEEELDRYMMAWTYMLTKTLDPTESIAAMEEVVKEGKDK